jgi:hypothetical protein
LQIRIRSYPLDEFAIERVMISKKRAARISCQSAAIAAFSVVLGRIAAVAFASLGR